jgi:hypothetical protein
MTKAKPLLRAWWRLVDTRIGIIPLPLLPLILALMAGFVWLGKLPPDLTMMIPLIALDAYVCAEIGGGVAIIERATWGRGPDGLHNAHWRSYGTDPLPTGQEALAQVRVSPLRGAAGQTEAGRGPHRASIAAWGADHAGHAVSLP